MKYYQIPSRLVAVVFAAPLSLLLSSQATAQIYSQTFNTGASTSLDNIAIGWSAYENEGTDLSSSTGDPIYVAADGRVFIGSSSANQGGAYAILSDAPTIDTTQYETDLTISWAQGGNDRDIDDPILGWRVLAEVGGEWYASEFQESTGFSTMSVVVSNSTWQTWTIAETDVTNGFTFASGDFDAATTISGDIYGLGLLAIDGSSADNDSLVLNNSFEVTGTAIPEPASFDLLLGHAWIGLGDASPPRLSHCGRMSSLPSRVALRGMQGKTVGLPSRKLGLLGTRAPRADPVAAFKAANNRMNTL